MDKQINQDNRNRRKITNASTKHWEELNEIDSGDLLFYLKHIQDMHPEQYKYRNDDKLNKSYPNGDNYKDLQRRVYKVLDTIDMTGWYVVNYITSGNITCYTFIFYQDTHRYFYSNQT